MKTMGEPREKTGEGHLAYERLHRSLETLKLPTVGGIVDGYLSSSAAEGRSSVEILDYLLDEEVKARQGQSEQMRMKLAHFPMKKTLDEFDYKAQPSVDPRVIEDLRTMRFVHNAENVIFVGPPGVGKSHLAIGLGYEAVKSGFYVIYTTSADLLRVLKKKAEEDRLGDALRQYGRARVLIVDEIGYLPMDKVGAHLLFQLVNSRYEKVSTIFTSNKAYSEWGEVMGDMAIAAATLDRILHHSTTVNIRGESFRLRARRKGGVIDLPPPAGSGERTK